MAARNRVVINRPQARRAAVLVAIVGFPSGPGLLCFERTHDVLDHKGEICLPGGSADPTDDGPVATALREAQEELGISPSAVDVMGELDDVYTSVSNYVITPVVGHVASPPVVVPDALEVARPIAVAISDLLDAGTTAIDGSTAGSARRSIYAFEVGGDRIWGATARIIHALLETWLGIAEGHEASS